MADEFEEYERLVEQGQNGSAPPAPLPEAAADKDRERSSRRDGEGKRERRDRSKERSRRSRSRDHSRERRRDKQDRENDFRGPDGSRRRSRSHDRRSSRDERDKYRDRDRDMRDRGRDRDRARLDRYAPRRRSPTPPEVRAQRERERELKELERATRTVFAYNINIKADERDIFEFFSKAGEVTDIRIITDRHTKRSKGLAYIEFSKQEEVFAALTLTGQSMLNQPVMVKPAEAEKNLAWEAAQAAKANAGPDAELAALGLGPVGSDLGALVAAAPEGPLRLQVTGFKQGLGENEIRQIFEPFGAVDGVSVVRDASGAPVSIAYVVFASAQDGRNAMQHWNGASLLDHVLAVTPVALADGASSAAGGAAGGLGELDDEEGGLKIDAQKRAALMNRLASSAGIQPATVPGALSGPAPYAVPGANPAAAAAAAAAAATAAAMGAAMLGPGALLAPGLGLPGAAAVPGGAADLALQQGKLGPASPIPTPCLLLKGMFTAATQSEPEWEVELEQDVQDECSKFGPVLHVLVDKDSQGFVYIKFGSTEAAQAAAKVLNGRFYNGSMIQAEFQFLQVYNQVFGLQ